MRDIMVTVGYIFSRFSLLLFIFRRHSAEPATPLPAFIYSELLHFSQLSSSIAVIYRQRAKFHFTTAGTHFTISANFEEALSECDASNMSALTLSRTIYSLPPKVLQAPRIPDESYLRPRGEYRVNNLKFRRVT